MGSLSVRVLSPTAPEPARTPVRYTHALVTSQDGWTALHHAASDGDVVVVRALLEGGSSRKIKNEVRASQLVAALAPTLAAYAVLTFACPWRHTGLLRTASLHAKLRRRPGTTPWSPCSASGLSSKATVKTMRTRKTKQRGMPNKYAPVGSLCSQVWEQQRSASRHLSSPARCV